MKATKQAMTSSRCGYAVEAATFARRIAGALRDLAPIIVVIAFFQIVVLQQPFPNLGGVAVGLLCVVAGLALSSPSRSRSKARWA